MKRKFDYNLRAPLDEEGYVRSFLVTDSITEMTDFYQTYGVVVFRDILVQHEMDDLTQEILNDFHVDLQDCTTWRRSRTSFVGQEPFTGIHAWQTRQHPNVYEAFSTLYKALSHDPSQVTPLIACVDRGSVMVPTKGKGSEQYLTSRLPHFDMNPFEWCGLMKVNGRGRVQPYDNWSKMLSEGNHSNNVGYPKLRGVLSLTKSGLDEGGFECVVGFHNILREWCEENTSCSQNSRIPTDDPLLANMQHITVRAGSLIIFTAELPHTPCPNRSDNPRVAIYLRMTPLKGLQINSREFQKRRQLVVHNLPPAFVMSELGREVFLGETLKKGR
eukprot:TRINITY_DN5562_c0_g1_i2.p1 TRINITY_DN5562_c0_g1~~TRINITY_DN5562_c0_g1_i2.p1  ORF type:complete len:330 (+),score=53.15 TRINITY_DN5562_c0_g1_i2:681-1670(+)